MQRPRRNFSVFRVLLFGRGHRSAVFRLERRLRDIARELDEPFNRCLLANRGRCLVFVDPVDSFEHPVAPEVAPEIIVELLRHQMLPKLIVRNFYQLTQRQNILVKDLVKNVVQNVEFGPLYAVLGLGESDVVQVGFGDGVGLVVVVMLVEVRSEHQLLWENLR